MNDSVKAYRDRRDGRLTRKFNKDGQSSVEAYRKRRYSRLCHRAGMSEGIHYDWNEEDHPRDESGKFTNGSGSGSVPSGGVTKGTSAGGGAGKTASAKSSFGIKYSSSFKSNTGKSYPTPKAGSVYDEDTLKEVNRLAEEGKKDKEYDKVLSNLTDDDIRYQKDPEGQVVASIPGLSQMYDNQVVGKSPEVQAAYDKRVEAGKQITEDMIEISDSLGSRMMGLENCFKGGASTARKIEKVKGKEFEKSGKHLTDEEALAKMDDVVRYSYKCDHDQMISQIKDLESALEKKGYEITDRDNKFLPLLNEDGEEVPRNYKAVHLQVKSPSGELFEVQIHSEETVKIKNMNHESFEAQRKIDLKKNPEMKGEYDRLEKIMVDNVSKLREPNGIMDLPNRGKSVEKQEALLKRIEAKKRGEG